MKILRGIIKKVPKEEHFDGHEKGIMELKDLTLADTIIKCNGENGEFEMLPIRLSYQDVDNNGNEKYTYDQASSAYIKNYRQTAIVYARGKEMRILVELGEYSPVKLVVSESIVDERTFYKVECVQNQHCGLE